MTRNQTFFHVTVCDLVPNSVIKRGNYGNNLTGETQDVRVKEYLAERIRRVQYPRLPSRMKSTFVFEKVADAWLFRKHFRDGECVYRVRFKSRMPVTHRTAYTAFPGSQPKALWRQQAFEMWAENLAYVGSFLEVFAESDLIVEASLSPPP